MGAGVAREARVERRGSRRDAFGQSGREWPTSATPATFAGFGGPFLLDVLVEAARDGDVGGVVEVGLLSQVILLLVVERV